uniref:Glutathione S-transferase 1-1 n=1 Tax=Caligus clemensi TaxID=344056 RepID=C1C046_CALCM|nr:Glutathione S-transferase 1-1 [Caligus clemensi]
MSLRIHGTPFSSPYRTVAMTAEILRVKYELVKVNPLKGDALKPDFLAINPQHNIPVMEHGKFTLNESRAIVGYLATEFDKSRKLYPNDTSIHAKINQRLYFDSNVFYKRICR